MLKHREHAEFMRRVLSRAGVPLSVLEREAGIAHGALIKYLNMERLINPADVAVIIMAMDRHDHSVAVELGGYFMPPDGGLAPKAIDSEFARRLYESLQGLLRHAA